MPETNLTLTLYMVKAYASAIIPLKFTVKKIDSHCVN